MASIKFKFPKESFLRLVKFIEDLGFSYVSVSMYKDKRDVTRKYTFCTQKDYPHDNGHFFYYPKFIDYEPAEIKEFINENIGLAYAVDVVFGGPYLELLFYVRGEDRLFEGDLYLKPVYWLKDRSEIKPDDKNESSIQ